MKKCTVCHQKKPLDEFYADARSKDKHRKDCKKCNCESRRQWQKNNLDKVLEKNRKWKENNKEHWKKWKENYTPRNNILRKKRYHENEKVRQKIIEQVHGYRNNPKNKKTIRETAKRLRNKYKQDPLWRIRMNLRRRLSHVLHGNRKYKPTMKLVGCSYGKLKSYLESKFVGGMTWENYGRDGWHVDHIIPCSSFDLSTLEGQQKCFHYTNLQPLWAPDNLSKGNKY